MVETTCDILVFVSSASLHGAEAFSVKEVWPGNDHITYAGQMRNVAILALVKSLRTDHDEAHDSVLWPVRSKSCRNSAVGK